MLKVIDKPRPELSPYAPKIITMTINPEKLRMLSVQVEKSLTG